jgi:hypothetical protein
MTEVPLIDVPLIDVPLKDCWPSIISADTLINWFNENNMKDGHDWDFKSARVNRPIFMFLKEQDAVAFKIKFSDIIK